MPDLLVLALDHAANKSFDCGLHLILTPKFENSFITLLLGVIAHAQRRFMWVVRVERVSKEV